MFMWESIMLLCCTVGAWGFYSEFAWVTDRIKRRKIVERGAVVKPPPTIGDHFTRMMVAIVGIACVAALYLRNPEEGRIAAALVLVVFVVLAIASGKFFRIKN
ncbi:MAG: hypothetical protein FJ319_11405 [SAR202 cluster bacterium]|nr:hypothetical protein [SAR202 cluster bacterium]